MHMSECTFSNVAARFNNVRLLECVLSGSSFIVSEKAKNVSCAISCT